MGFADDIAVVSVAKTVREIEEKTNIMIRNVGAWLNEVGLTLVAISISVRNIVAKMKATVGGTRI